MKLCARLLLAAAAACAAVAAAATTFRVDDSRSVVSTPLIRSQWRHMVPGPQADHTVEGRFSVRLHLNVEPWLNRTGRIYMALAPVAGAPIQAQWQTQGRLLAGTVTSGARALVYEGPISQRAIEETIALTLTTDGRAHSGVQTLQFYFEIDVPS